MNIIIEWKLLNNNAVLIHRKNEEAFISEDSIIVYNHKEESNKIDLNKKTFDRTTEELRMLIDFHEKKCKLFFEEGIAELDVDCSFKTDIKHTVLKYNIDGDEKIIKINVLKEL